MHYCYFVSILVILLETLIVLTKAQRNIANDRSCPSQCTCDNVQKRVLCKFPDSSYSVDVNAVGNDVQILEISPSRTASKSVYGPAVPAVFGQLGPLFRLVINNNDITKLPAATVRQLSQLASLDLSGNHIANIGDLSLSSFRDLISLTLAQNDIDTLRTDDLRSLSSLQALNLAENKISRIEPRALDSQGFLRVLDLHDNALSQIPDDLFDRIERVERLDLRANQLAVVPRGILRLQSLRFLLLDNNRLATISKDFVQAWLRDPFLTDATFYGNPLQCDQGLEEFVNWIKTPTGRQQVCIISGRTGDKAKSGNCPVCASPRNVQGKLADSLSKADLAGGGISDVSSSRLTAPNNAGANSFNGDQRPLSTDKPNSNPNVRRDTDDKNSPNQRFGNVGMSGSRCSSTNCYMFSVMSVSKWGDAQFACQAFGWKLVEITNSDEQRTLLAFLSEVVKEDPNRNSASHGWWIGARLDPTSGRSRAFALPSSGKPLLFTNWDRGQPNAYSGSDGCVELLDSGFWSVFNCQGDMSNKFICQFPPNTRS